MQLIPSKTQHFDLAALGWVLQRAQGDPFQATELCKHFLRPSYPKTEIYTRAMVEGHALTGIDGYQHSVGSFINSLASISGLDAMLPSSHRLPLRAAVVSIIATMVGSSVAEGALKPISKLELANGGIDPWKATCIIVLSEEVQRFSPDVAIPFINGELRTGVTYATNERLFSYLVDGVVAAASTGDPRADLAGRLAVIAANGMKVFWFVDQLTAIQLATYTVNGVLAFPLVGINGGVISGVSVLVVDGLPEDSNGKMQLIVDANGLALASETILLRSTRHGDIVMDDAPAPGAQSVTSMFQTNSTALAAERFFGAQKLRATSVAAVSGASYEPAS